MESEPIIITDMEGSKTIIRLLQTKGGMVIESSTAPENLVELAEKEGWIMTCEKTGKVWIWVESLLNEPQTHQ